MTYQSESTIRENLLSLRSIPALSVSPNQTLQVPFPPLNKFSPPSAVSSIAGSTHEPLAVMASGSSNKHGDDVGASAAQDGPPTGGKEDCELVASGSHGTTDWLSLAEKFLSILKRAVHDRVIRAPFVPLRRFSPTDDLPPPVPEGIEHRSSNQSLLSESPLLLTRPAVTDKQFQTGLEDELFEASQPPVSRRAASPYMRKRDLECPEVVRGRARVGVLFSGGVDSAVLAALTDR